jgi:hypothetical protein
MAVSPPLRRLGRQPWGKGDCGGREGIGRAEIVRYKRNTEVVFSRLWL